MLFNILFVLSGGSVMLSLAAFVFYKFTNIFKRYKECPNCKGHDHEIVKVGKFEYNRCKLCLYPNLENEYENKLVSMEKSTSYVELPKKASQNPILIQNLRNKYQIEFAKKGQYSDFQKKKLLA